MIELLWRKKETANIEKKSLVMGTAGTYHIGHEEGVEIVVERWPESKGNE